MIEGTQLLVSELKVTKRRRFFCVFRDALELSLKCSDRSEMCAVWQFMLEAKKTKTTADEVKWMDVGYRDGRASIDSLAAGWTRDRA